MIAAPLAAQNFHHDQVIEERFEMASGGLLTIDSDLGSIELTGGGGNDVVVTVIKGANNVSRRDAEELFDRFRLDFDQSGRGLEIKGDYDRPGGRWNNGNRGLRVIYRIVVPENINVDLKTAGGSIQVEHIAGEATLRTSGGSLALDDVGGRVSAHTSGGSIKARHLGSRVDLNTSGGSITVEGAGGAVDASTSGGSISISDVNGPVDASTSGGGIRLEEIAGNVNASTSGGSIEAEILGQPDDDMKLSTSGGSVTVHLDSSVSADIDAQASGGSVRTDFPVTVRGTLKKTKLQGEINGGGPLLTLRSSGGSVRILEN
jgi:DUF4097 and DUF4098 domain-containing protein YvlB